MLWMTGVLIGAITLGRFGPNPWIVIAFIATITIVGVAILMAVFRHRLAGVPTLPSLPAKVLWHRRCFNCGLPFFIVGQLLGIVSRPYVPTDDWSDYISITGSGIFLLFILAGFAAPPRVKTASRAE